MKKIRNTLLIFYLTPVLILQLASGVFFFTITKKSLDEELGSRLTGIASTLALQIKEIELQALQTLAAESETNRNLLKKLVFIKEKNELSAVYLLLPNGEILLGTNENIPKGTIPPQLTFHESEIEQAKSGKTTDSILFKGSDGRFYKSAFSPVQLNGQTLAIVGIDASAAFFKNLNRLTQGLMYFAMTCIAVVIFVSLLISQKIVKPLEELSQLAKDIGYGQLNNPISVRSDNELAVLGKAMEDMRKKILVRDQELNLMLQGIAHEVRNPLGGMELFAGLLQDEVSNEKSKNYVSRIQNEIRNLKKLVEEFLDYARGLFPDKREIHLLSLVSEVKDYFHEDLKQKSVEIILECDPHVRVVVDIDQMKRALSNLLKNAIQASRPNSKIWINAIQLNQGFKLSIRDEGCGVTPEALPQLFEPFYTTKEKGSGLGLSFVQKIVQAHHGTIEVKSELNQGTEFTIYV